MVLHVSYLLKTSVIRDVIKQIIGNRDAIA